MKKTRILSLMLALCLILLLAGCGASTSGEVSEAAPEKTPEEQVTGTVAGLMDRLVDGQPKEAKKFCAEGIREADLFEEFFDPDDPESAYEYGIGDRSRSAERGERRERRELHPHLQ